MGKKSKKLIAGLGVGLALTGGLMFAGCSSDITFNQEDLDRTLANINNYLELTQNHDEKYVKMELNKLLMDGVINSIGDNTVAYSLTSAKYKDGEKTVLVDNVYKRAVENKVVKEYVASKDGLNKTYTERTKTDEGIEIYKYELSNGTKTVTSNLYTDEDPLPATMLPFADYATLHSVLLAIIQMNEDTIEAGAREITEDGTEIYRLALLNSSGQPEDPGSVNKSVLTYAFKDNKIAYYEAWYTYVDNSYMVDRYDFNHTNTSISFDKTGFVEA